MTFLNPVLTCNIILRIRKQLFCVKFAFVLSRVTRWMRVIGKCRYFAAVVCRSDYVFCFVIFQRNSLVPHGLITNGFCSRYVYSPSLHSVKCTFFWMQKSAINFSIPIWEICKTIIILPVVLYGCETWSPILREECRLSVFENRFLKRSDISRLM